MQLHDCMKINAFLQHEVHVHVLRLSLIYLLHDTSLTVISGYIVSVQRIWFMLVSIIFVLDVVQHLPRVVSFLCRFDGQIRFFLVLHCFCSVV